MNSNQSHAQWQLSIGNDARGESPQEAKFTQAHLGKAGTSIGSTVGVGSFSSGKKTVLLVDLNPHTCDSRAKVMRTLGVTVHCAASAGAARSRLESGSYNLVLVDLGRDVDGAEDLAHEIRIKNPHQLVAFLVGSPLFVATTLSGNRTPKPSLPPSATAVSVQKANTPAVGGIDFGQKIRDAEAEQAF